MTVATQLINFPLCLFRLRFCFLNNLISNSKKMIFQFQDSSASHIASATAGAANSSNNQGIFRRMIDAVRHCFTKRSRSKKPDWLLDKQTNRSRSKSIPSEDVSHGSSTANLLCSWLSVDPSLPSHYRVCNRIPFEVLCFRFFVFSLSPFHPMLKYKNCRNKKYYQRTCSMFIDCSCDRKIYGDIIQNQ